MGCDGMCTHLDYLNKNKRHYHGDINEKESHLGDLGNIFVEKDGFSEIDMISDKIR